MCFDQSYGTKKMKWEESQVLYGFQMFGDPRYPIDFDGPFRDNIYDFLQDFTKWESQDLENMLA